MGLLDLFRPKWRHSSVEVRSEAVRHLDSDDGALAEVALKDPESMVRRLAIKKIVDVDLLARIAEGDSDEALRKSAAEKASEILVGKAVADNDGALDAVTRLSAPKALAEVARSAAREPVWRAALAQLVSINDGKALAEVARQAKSTATRHEALAHVTDAGVLRSVALNDSHEAICLFAVGKLGDVNALEQIAQKSKQKSVRNAAKERLLKVAPGREAPVGKKATQRKAMQRQLCARAEAAVTHGDLDDASAELESVRDAWAELGVQAGDDELRVRFTKAVEKFEERRNQKATPAAAAPVVATPPPVEKPHVDAEALAHEQAERSRLQAERDVERAERDAQREAERVRKQAERDAKEAEKKQRQAEKEADRAANKDVWTAACERLESLAGAEDRAQLESAIKSAAEATDGARDLPRDDDAALRPRYEAARKVLAIKLQELRELDRWKSWANVPRLEALVVKMEALSTAGVVGDAKETAGVLKSLQAEWKAVGPAPREKRDALWEKFKKAADEVYGRVKEQFAQVDADRTTNLTKKEEMCTRVEALAEDSNWKETSETIKLLQEEWKAIGPVPKEKSDELWRRFRGACDKFFERRKAHFGEVDANRDGNLAKQEALLAKVEAVADSSNFKDTAELIKEYQAEWKSIGPGPKEKSEEVWKKFRAACDGFFERRKAYFAELDAERGENLRKKLLLCEKVEALAEADDESTLDVVKGLQAEWKTVGPAPKDQADEVWERFRGACDKIFDRRRQAEPAAPVVSVANDVTKPSGISGFTNKLPLADIAAGWSDLAAADDKDKK